MRVPAAAWIAACMAVALLAPAHAASDAERYEIMRPETPEPWLAPKYKSPRGTPKRVAVPQPTAPVAPRAHAPPPPIVVPQTGRVLPNLPAAPGAAGRESAQDRALRCAHQTGVYGSASGDRGAYLGTCINQ